MTTAQADRVSVEPDIIFGNGGGINHACIASA